MLTLLNNNKSTASEELKSKYLDVIIGCLEHIPEESRPHALRGSFKRSVLKNLIELVFDSYTNVDAACKIICTMSSDDEGLVEIAVQKCAKMLMNESQIIFGSQLIREMLKTKDRIENFRSKCIVLYLEKVLKCYTGYDIGLYERALMVFSLLVEVCTEYQLCCASLRAYEFEVQIELDVENYISGLKWFGIYSHVAKDFDDLYLKLKTLLDNSGGENGSDDDSESEEEDD